MRDTLVPFVRQLCFSDVESSLSNSHLSWHTGMFIYGIFGKVGAFFTSIPQPVLGGMSTFLFANIAVSGIKVMTSEGVDRRARFIMAVSASFGIG